MQQWQPAKCTWLTIFLKPAKQMNDFTGGQMPKCCKLIKWCPHGNQFRWPPPTSRAKWMQRTIRLFWCSLVFYSVSYSVGCNDKNAQNDLKYSSICAVWKVSEINGWYLYIIDCLYRSSILVSDPRWLVLQCKSLSIMHCELCHLRGVIGRRFSFLVKCWRHWEGSVIEIY